MAGTKYVETDNKTEIIVIRTRPQKSKIDIPHININGIYVVPTSTVGNLGVIFDNEMSIKAHVSSTGQLTLS